MRILKLMISITFLFISKNFIHAQKVNSQVNQKLPQPKLVVGIVVDQMRYDYLYRYYSKFSEGGFKRLMNEGFNCRNNHFNYVPTYTAAGHSAIFTGSCPAINGIIGNEWYNVKTGKNVYCTDDSSVTTVGNNGIAGKMSPKNLLVSTLPDQLKLANNLQSKTIGIALKDRGAILPAGHTADAAYWNDSMDGNWISSTFYMKELPKWVMDFNAKKKVQAYMATKWETLLPINQYTESAADDMHYEGKLDGEAKPIFPHELIARQGNSIFEPVRYAPFGNTLTKDFAIEAIINEKLGKGEKTDFLTLSFSSTDYAGHRFGPNSIEVEDVYLRLDRDIEDFLNKIDKELGKNNTLIFLTADHGAADVPARWVDLKLPAGVLNLKTRIAVFKEALNKKFGVGEYISSEENYQLYLNKSFLEENKVSINDVYETIREVALSYDDMADVVNLHDIKSSTLNNYQIDFIKNGFNPRRSGDIYLLLNPSWFAGYKTGTTHGAMYRYDTHVPLLFYGWGVNKGETSTRTSITDIAPTVADILSILEPNGSIGNPIEHVKLKK